MDISKPAQEPRTAVVVSLEELKQCQVPLNLRLLHILMYLVASIAFESLEEAFGPCSLGIIIVKDLPSRFVELRHKLLSYASYLANLSSEELGICLPWSRSLLCFWS